MLREESTLSRPKHRSLKEERNMVYGEVKAMAIRLVLSLKPQGKGKGVETGGMNVKIGSQEVRGRAQNGSRCQQWRHGQFRTKSLNRRSRRLTVLSDALRGRG